jgi:flagellar biosynthesis protein FliR
VFTTAELANSLLAVVWTMLRVGGMVMVAPLLGALYIPSQVRVLITAVPRRTSSP